MTGASGFFGAVMAQVATEAGHDVTPVTRAGYAAASAAGGYDLVVNAAMPSGRFRAECNPEEDFRETVEKTFRIRRDFAPARLLQVSSVSARCQRDRVYGRHKRAAEALVDDGRNLVVRLGPLYHETLSKGVILDILRGDTVHAAAGSRYAFTPAAWAAAEMLRRCGESGVIEIGARGALRLDELAAALGSASGFRGAEDHQEFPDAPARAPAADEVIGFAEALRRHLGERAQ
ncbi:NAD(P)-dependent oxidoreductase [Oceanicella sp. SM1341]|uniref:NAD(P)-dependent oxidoreductase n=1 Tax=Oceanicella sp. SM1341 TaxID=1548889 RepID=UPI00130025EA|nr:NAD(P)-dependent oxidoreductase [Oceanicella sp. SM1341]